MKQQLEESRIRETELKHQVEQDMVNETVDHARLKMHERLEQEQKQMLAHEKQVLAHEKQELEGSRAENRALTRQISNLGHQVQNDKVFETGGRMVMKMHERLELEQKQMLAHEKQEIKDLAARVEAEHEAATRAKEEAEAGITDELKKARKILGYKPTKDAKAAGKKEGKGAKKKAKK